MPTLYPTQQAHVEQMVRKFEHDDVGFDFLCADTGTGKTPTSVVLADRIAMTIARQRLDGQWPVTLVITDATVKFNWVAEIQKWCATPLTPQDVMVIDGDLPTRMVQLSLMMMRRPRFVVTNYDTARLHLPIFQSFFGDPMQNIIIVDEADRIQSMESLRSVAVRALEARFKAALTATPVANRADTLYPILQFLDPGPSYMRERDWNGESTQVRYHRGSEFWDSEQKFVQRYCTFNDYGQVNGSKNIPELHRRLEQFGMTRWHKREMLDLPPIEYETVIRPLSPSQQVLYDRLKDGFINWVEDKGKAVWFDSRYDSGARGMAIQNILAQLTYLRRAATLSPHAFMRSLIRNKYPEFEWDSRGLTLDDDSAKNLWLKSYIAQEYGEFEELPDYGGVYVWSQWTDTLDGLQETLNGTQERMRALRLDGSCSPQKRFEIQEKVMSGQCKLLLSSPAGGRGINFQRLDTAVLMDLPWTPKDVDQATGRVDRAEQKAERVTVISVLAKDTIDTKRMLKVVHQKQADTNEILDGKRGGKSKSVLNFGDLDEVASWV